MTKIIYILTNPVMPDLVKIGKTSNLENKIRELSTHSGIPVPFEVYYAYIVADSNKVESYLHDRFKNHRINPKREFFRISPEKVLSILKQVESGTITPSGDYVENQKRTTIPEPRKKRSDFNFFSVAIPIGSTLTFVNDETITSTVVHNKKIEFEERVMSLSPAALFLLNHYFGWDSESVCGTDYWKFENEILSERRLRLENEDN